MYNTRAKTQKVYKKNKPALNIVPKNCVCVFPIELVGGKTQVSNLGIMPNRKYYDKGSFLYWQEVFDGRSALKIQWEDSITLEKPEGKNYYLAKTQVGKYYYGKPISNGTEGLDISEDASFSDFVGMKASQTITIRFEYEPENRESSKWELQKLFRFALVDNDIYNLYQIPEVCESKLMYIAEHNEFFDDLTGLAKGCDITFATLGDKIQNSGKAIEQYCSWNAPGEFAVIPKIIEYYDEETEEWEKEVIINPTALYLPTPVKYLQVEQQGPALTSTIYAIGRRQEWDEENECWKIGPSKFLLPCEFVTTQPNPLNRSATPTKNFFCFPDEQVTMVTNTEVLKWIQDNATQPLEQIKNAGMISIGNNWTDQFDNNSNPITDGIRKDYFDKNWFPLSYEGATLTEYDTSGCIYAADTMQYSASDTMIDIMCKNAFIFNQQPTIPLSYYSTKPLYLRNIPLIGSIANFFKIGDIKLSSNTTSRKNSNLCFFGDSALMAMCANLNGSFGTSFKEGSKVFPINFFGTNENMYQKLGVNSANTTFCVALTDQVIIDNTIWDTIYLGQSQYEDGKYLFESKQSLLANSTLKPATPATSNFIIDAVVVQSIFDGKIRLSCYGEEENNFIYPQWTATILSNANWENGNMRDWTNIFLLSNWEERFCVQEDEFTWPMVPHKKNDDNYTWTTNAISTFTNNSASTWWQNISGFAWPQFTKSQGLAISNLSKQFYESTISYTDLGKEEITDKDSFLTYFGNVKVSIDSSLLKVGTYTKTIIDGSHNIDFVAGTYTYTKEFECATIRRDGKWQVHVAGNKTFTLRTSNVALPNGPGHYAQKFRITLTLEDTIIRVVLTDISMAYLETSKTNVSYDFTNCFLISQTKLSNEDFTTYMKVSSLTFVKKQS